VRPSDTGRESGWRYARTRSSRAKTSAPATGSVSAKNENGGDKMKFGGDKKIFGAAT